MTKYESISVGDRAEIRHVLTDHDISRFVELTGDDNRLHVDAKFASTTSFKRPVAHGMLGASFISTIIGTKLPGDGALWYSQTLEFLLPVHVGDELLITAEVVGKIDRLKAIEIRTDIHNQHKQQVTGGVARVKIVEPDVPTADVEAEVAKARTVLVVGGSGGIGTAACLRLARDGFAVAIHCHRNKESAEAARQRIADEGGTAMVVVADILQDSQTQAMIESVLRRFGSLAAVVLCVTPPIATTRFERVEWADMQLHFDMNVKALFAVAKAVVPHMRETRYGKIVTVTTIAAESAPPPEQLAYVTAKSALAGFSKALAVELAPQGIRVNMVSPGMTDTPLIAAYPEKARLLTAARTPLRRLGTPEDVAEAIFYLVSASSDYLTGETIRVNGGQVML